MSSRFGLEPGVAFSAQWLGGTAIGKNLDLPADPDAGVIVLDTAGFGSKHQAAVLPILLMVHEVAHADVETGSPGDASPEPTATDQDQA